MRHLITLGLCALALWFGIEVIDVSPVRWIDIGTGLWTIITIVCVAKCFSFSD